MDASVDRLVGMPLTENNIRLQPCARNANCVCAGGRRQTTNLNEDYYAMRSDNTEKYLNFHRTNLSSIQGENCVNFDIFIDKILNYDNNMIYIKNIK